MNTRENILAVSRFGRPDHIPCQVALATKMATGTWTHDYTITASEAKELGLPVRVGMPDEVLTLMTLYPQPIQKTSSVEYLPNRELPRLFGSTE